MPYPLHIICKCCHITFFYDLYVFHFYISIYHIFYYLHLLVGCKTTNHCTNTMYNDNKFNLI